MTRTSMQERIMAINSVLRAYFVIEPTPDRCRHWNLWGCLLIKVSLTKTIEMGCLLEMSSENFIKKAVYMTYLMPTKN